jgi:hypothetical protein
MAAGSVVPVAHAAFAVRQRDADVLHHSLVLVVEDVAVQDEGADVALVPVQTTTVYGPAWPVHSSTPPSISTRSMRFGSKGLPFTVRSDSCRTACAMAGNVKANRSTAASHRIRARMRIACVPLRD